ncbi:hypothetical protein AKJ64_01220, partial [candidate division MSBL1 archaeon SCGC-AAA259E17]
QESEDPGGVSEEAGRSFLRIPHHYRIYQPERRFPTFSGGGNLQLGPVLFLLIRNNIVRSGSPPGLLIIKFPKLKVTGRLMIYRG